VDQADLILSAQFSNIPDCQVVDPVSQFRFLFSLINGSIGCGIYDSVGLGRLNALADAVLAAKINSRKITGNQTDILRAGSLQFPSQLPGGA
jgi:hypothetical protein